MPLVFSEHAPFGTTVAAWEVTESRDFFLEHLHLDSADLKMVAQMHSRRALEWCASRYLLLWLVGRERAEHCTKDDHGKPYIPDDPVELSISHSHGMAALIVSERPVGVDVQKRTEKIRRVQHKFVGEKERAAINAETADLTYHICWSAKECLFKVYAKGRVDFRKDLFVELPERPDSEGHIAGYVHKSDPALRCHIKYRFLKEHVLVYAIQDALH